MPPVGRAVAVIATLPATFLAYEVLFVLAHGEGAFNTGVVGYVALVEVIIFLALLIVHSPGVGAVLVEPNAVENAS